MKGMTVLLVLAVLVVAALAAGCTGSSSDTTPVTTAQPTTAVATETTAAVSLVPEPTDVIPDNYAVSVTVQKDQVYNTLTVTFNGGKGQENVIKLTATVIRSDGTTETKSLDKPSGSSLKTGQTIEFTGTTGQDRVEVWATMDRPLGDDNARVFKIYDGLLPSK